jgi:hypothetical protein
MANGECIVQEKAMQGSKVKGEATEAIDQIFV